MKLSHGWEYFCEALLPRVWPGPAKEVLYVIDRAAWSFYWDGKYITSGLRRLPGVKARLVHEPWAHRNKIIHFGSRYAYIHGPHQRLHESNHLFLTWFHGEPWDPSPAIQKLFAEFAQVEGRLEKIVVSNSTCKRGLEEFGISDQRLVNIPLGVDLNRFSPVDNAQKAAIRKELGIPPDAFCIGSFQKDGTGWGDGGEPKLIKGPDVFLEVVAQLAKRHKNLWVVLTGPSRGYVKSGLERIGVGYTHRFLESYLDIVPYYQSLDLYLITSRTEGGPKALLESWASGVPLVSTKVGMPADLVEHGRNGMLAEVEDVESLSESALGLMDDAEIFESLRSQALLDVRAYDWPLVAQEYYRHLYEPILAGMEK